MAIGSLAPRPLARSRLVAVVLTAVVCATLMAVAPLLASDARAARRPWSATTSALVNCVLDATPQVCDPSHLQKVRVSRGTRITVQRLRYTAATTHCSSARLLIYLNGARIGRTDWVDAGEDSTVELLDLTLRRRPGGKAHRFTYKVEGRTGGCNGGMVGSWAGDIKLSGSKRAA
jgi:hypothetical protein